MSCRRRSEQSVIAPPSRPMCPITVVGPSMPRHSSEPSGDAQSSEADDPPTDGQTP